MQTTSTKPHFSIKSVVLTFLLIALCFGGSWVLVLWWRESFILAMLSIALLFLVIMLGAWIFFVGSAQRRAESHVEELNHILRIINKILRHDVKGKLTAIRWAIESSKTLTKSPQGKDVYENVLSSITMVNEMKELEQSLCTGGALKSYGLAELFNRMKKEEGMTIRRKGDAEVKADEALYSALANIVRNAKLHAGVKSVSVDIEDDHKRVIVKIKDKGKGIPEELWEAIFDEGVKHGETGNTGLGLYIVRQTIERYGGDVHIEANRPKGTVFVISLHKK